MKNGKAEIPFDFPMNIGNFGKFYIKYLSATDTAAMLMFTRRNIKAIRSMRHGKMQDLPFLHHAVQNAIDRRPAEKRVRMMEAGIYFVGCRMV